MDIKSIITTLDHMRELGMELRRRNVGLKFRARINGRRLLKMLSYLSENQSNVKRVVSVPTLLPTAYPMSNKEICGILGTATLVLGTLGVVVGLFELAYGCRRCV
jgi:hypothetical protein